MPDEDRTEGPHPLLTREVVLGAFDAIGAEAARRGIVAEIAVYGGTCIMLASDIRQATGDVDAVFLSDAALLYEMADSVGRRLGLPDGWLNQAVKRVAPPPGGAEPNLLLFGDYPRDDGNAVGLRVFLPTPSYLLAMKILANRGDDHMKTQSDMQDLHGLMRITGIDTFVAIEKLLHECYPLLPGLSSSTLMPRLAAKIASTLDAYQRDPHASDPSWHAGRGAATRPQG